MDYLQHQTEGVITEQQKSGEVVDGPDPLEVITPKEEHAT